LLALTIGTVGIVLVQVVFGLLEVKKRRLQERLGSSPETSYEAGYGPIANTEKQDLSGLLAKSPFMLGFHAKLARAYPGVLIQRTTGGDLAEVLTNIGTMVRARIRLQQHVKAITAEGRMVGYILLVLPIIFFFILYMINRRYAEVLIKDPQGIYVLGVAVA